jgi:hypothetical protein
VRAARRSRSRAQQKSRSLRRSKRSPQTSGVAVRIAIVVDGDLAEVQFKLRAKPDAELFLSLYQAFAVIRWALGGT